MQKNFNPHHENRTAFTGIPKIRQEEHMQELDYAGIGMRIRAARKSKGWSQDKVAAECGISLSFMGHIERGNLGFTLDDGCRGRRASLGHGEPAAVCAGNVEPAG